jgi:hypothetical protein
MKFKVVDIFLFSLKFGSSNGYLHENLHAFLGAKLTNYFFRVNIVFCKSCRNKVFFNFNTSCGFGDICTKESIEIIR